MIYRDRNKRPRWKVAGLVAALVAAGILAVALAPDETREAAAKAIGSRQTGPYRLTIVPDPPIARAVPAPEPPIAARESERAAFEAKAKSDDPRVKFEAYTLAYDCVTRPRLCGDLRPGDVSWDKRKPLVIDAALAGVPGAYAALSRYEVTGSTLTKDAYWPDPAEYAALVAKAKEAGVREADMTALSEVMAGPSAAPMGMSSARALQLWIELLAAKQWDEERTLYDPRADNTRRTKELAESLTEDEQRGAIESALAHIKQTRRIP